jgi:methylmalonyl-CoA mutase N-terminal domain/subunit
VFTAAYDEAFAIPTELAARTALRVQQIVAYESDVAKTVDPLAGSYFVEALTDEMERTILGIMGQIEERGGMVRCLEEGWIQRRIAERAFEYQRALDAGEVPVVGVNVFRSERDQAPEVHRGDPETERAAVSVLQRLRAGRDGAMVARALDRLEAEARGDGNLMGPIGEAVRAYATVGEIAGRLRRVFGEYQPPVGF